MSNQLTYNEAIKQLKERSDEFAEKLKALKKEEAALSAEDLSDLNMRKIRTAGGNMNSFDNLPFCIFNMDNEQVKWMGCTEDASDTLKAAYIQYATETVKTMNYSLNNMIGTSSEERARQKYLVKVVEGGQQFIEAVKDLLI